MTSLQALGESAIPRVIPLLARLLLAPLLLSEFNH